MGSSRVSSGMRAHRGLVWAVFCGVSAVALSAASVAALAAGSRSDLGLVLLGGLLVVGIAAAFLTSVVSSMPDDHGRGLAHGAQGFGGGDGGGAFGGGGDCGGGGGGDCG